MNAINAALRSHLLRLAALSILSVIIGLAIFFAGSGTAQKAFGTMTAGWAVVNLVIVGFSLRNKQLPDLRAFREFLMLNVGLNFGYIGVGLALCLPSGASAVLMGNGAAVAVQGLILQVLDLYLLRQLPTTH